MSGEIILYERKIRYNRTLTGFIKLLFPTLLRFRGWRTVDVEGSLPGATKVGAMRRDATVEGPFDEKLRMNSV